MTPLITVEEAFSIEKRVTLVVPHVDLGPGGPMKLELELRRPDGSRERCSAHAQIPMLNPPLATSSGPRHALMIPLPKERIPPGTGIFRVT